MEGIKAGAYYYAHVILTRSDMSKIDRYFGFTTDPSGRVVSSSMDKAVHKKRGSK